MATTYKVLGQIVPSATTLTTLYTVPSSTSTVCSTLVVCNEGTTTETVRVAVRPAGAAIDPKHYLVYDSYMTSNNTLFLTLGITIATTDVVSVYTSGTAIAFSLYGSEIT